MISNRGALVIVDDQQPWLPFAGGTVAR